MCCITSVWWMDVVMVDSRYNCPFMLWFSIYSVLNHWSVIFFLKQVGVITSSELDQVQTKYVKAVRVRMQHPRPQGWVIIKYFWPYNVEIICCQSEEAARKIWKKKRRKKKKRAAAGRQMKSNPILDCTWTCTHPTVFSLVAGDFKVAQLGGQAAALTTLARNWRWYVSPNVKNLYNRK